MHYLNFTAVKQKINAVLAVIVSNVIPHHILSFSPQLWLWISGGFYATCNPLIMHQLLQNCLQIKKVKSIECAQLAVLPQPVLFTGIYCTSLHNHRFLHSFYKSPTIFFCSLFPPTSFATDGCCYSSLTSLREEVG